VPADAGTTPHAIAGDALMTYAGAIDRSGNFSFNLVGTSRKVCFNFEAPLPLLTPPTIPSAKPPASDCYAAAFTTLSTASGGGLTSIVPGQTDLRGVRFNWANPSPSSPNDPVNYHLGFRGDSDLDGLVEMSQVKVTCEAGDARGVCTRWMLEPCAGYDASCGADAVATNSDGTAVGGPVGQVGGGFPKGRGNTTISRYVMSWRMVITR
jgi:hypothetical protein